MPLPGLCGRAWLARRAHLASFPRQVLLRCGALKLTCLRVLVLPRSRRDLAASSIFQLVSQPHRLNPIPHYVPICRLCQGLR